ncbi:MAG TPA: cysteine desulfurase family protein [Longimicrobiales bacterium]|nr:cysteine desulfurase family protein [Longimicrobiales bacterium]
MDAIYLDHAATTPVRPEVRAAMDPYFSPRFGNPSSAHRWGREARAALEEARERLAAALGAQRRELIFTSGGTEADNLAVLGRWRALADRGAVGVACSAIEHKAVLGAAHAAAAEGAEEILLAVDTEGRLDLGALDEALRARPAVVAVMWANNEVGTLQPVAEIATRCRAAGVAFHTDAIQAFGKVRVRVDEVPCDLLALSGHKIGAPKGIGALYVRSGVELRPLVHGGSQERELRPGTENVAFAVGLSVAAELAAHEQEEERARLEGLRTRLEARLQAAIPGLAVNGAGAPRAPQMLNVSIPGVEQDALLMALDLEGLAVSGGSACQSGAVEPSHVLVAMGRASPGEAAIRLSLGRTTTETEVDAAAERLPAVVERIRALAVL